MRHFCNIADNRCTRDVTAERNHQRIGSIHHFFRGKHFLERNKGDLSIGHLDADQRGACNRSLNTDGLDRHIHCNVRSEVRDLAQFDALCKLKLKPGDGRAVGDMLDMAGHFEGGQGFLQALRALGILFRIEAGMCVRFTQK